MKPVRIQPRRRKKSFSFIKGAIVVIGAMTLTTLAIQASDSFKIPKFGMLASVGESQVKERCGDGMALVSSENGGYCIDRYEVSAGDGCAHPDPLNQFETNENISGVKCFGISSPTRSPWVNVTLHQAMQICAKAGKHLATPLEWYRAALGTPDDTTSDICALGRAGQTRADKTGAHANCISSYGTYDMVGNVWEWVDASVEDGKYNGRDLPDEGYVMEADTAGVAAKSSTDPRLPFGGDYWFTDLTGLRGMFRGGFWGMDEKAGIYAVNTTIPPSFVGVAVGFRCAN